MAKPFNSNCYMYFITVKKESEKKHLISTPLLPPSHDLVVGNVMFEMDRISIEGHYGERSRGRPPASGKGLAISPFCLVRRTPRGRLCKLSLQNQAGLVGAGLAAWLWNWACLFRFWEPLEVSAQGSVIPKVCI